jgi:hypothetical protein
MIFSSNEDQKSLLNINKLFLKLSKQLIKVSIKGTNVITKHGIIIYLVFII